MVASFYSLQANSKPILILICLFLTFLLLWKRTDEEVVQENFREQPIIFIGGVARSGTTLMRAIMDTHPDVKCGQETRLLPTVIKGFKTGALRSADSFREGGKKGLPIQITYNAAGRFVYELLHRRNGDAKRLCDKDPFIMISSSFLSRVFPYAKFILMVRDGRAVAHSLLDRKVTVDQYNMSSYETLLKEWDTDVRIMTGNCTEVGENNCIVVHYEKLLLRPKEQLKRIIKFLDLTWTDNLLHHEDFIDTSITISKLEPSTSQIVKPLYLDSLDAWVTDVDDDFISKAPKLSPILQELGYDVTSRYPIYGTPESELVEAYKKRIKEQKDKLGLPV